MKTLRILAITAMLTLISAVTMAQNNSFKEIIAVGTVYELDEQFADVTADYSKHLKIDKTGLELGKEYRFRLIVSEIEKNEKWCSGCTGVLKAKVIGYSITARQAKRDANAVDNIQLGYSKSPRHH